MPAANSVQIGKVRDHRCLLTAKGKVDEVLDVVQIQLGRHSLIRGQFVFVESIQLHAQPTQLVEGHADPFQLLEYRNAALNLSDAAVSCSGLTYFQTLQYLPITVVIAFLHGKGQRHHPVILVLQVPDHCFEHHFLCLLSSISSISVRRQLPSRCQQMAPWRG